MSFLFNTIIYNPMYNGLVWLIDVLPGHDLGVAVIIFTIFIKVVLFPLSKGAVKTQIVMKQIDPELRELKVKYKDRQELAMKTLELYRKYKLNPFASIFLILIQLPIILALAWIFFKGGFPTINADLLYSFVNVPEIVNTHFLGILDVSVKSITLGIIAGVTQFFQIQYSIPKYEAKKDGTFQDDFARSMNMNMRYVLPAIVFFVSLGVSGAVALYWITSNLFTIAQEVYFRNTIKKDNKGKIVDVKAVAK